MEGPLTTTLTTTQMILTEMIIQMKPFVLVLT